MGRLQDRIALITGAGSGLGLATAKLFAAEGAHVVLNDLNGEAAEMGAAEIRDVGGTAFFIQADITNEDQVRAMVEAVDKTAGKLHVLVNNAGNLMRSDFRHMEDADWEQVLNPHLWGTIRMTRACFPLLTIANGAAVVNLSSIMATRHLRQLSAYSTVKAAIAGMSRALAVEFAPYNIRVNYICPGFIPTGLTNRYTDHPQVSQTLLTQTPMRRFGSPEEVAKVALFLASDDSAYTTGEGIMVDGGMSLNLA